MNEKDTELIKALAALLKKFKKLIHFGSSIFHHHHEIAEEDTHINDVSSYPHKNVDLLTTETVNDSTGENAIHAVLKKENLTNQEN